MSTDPSSRRRSSFERARTMVAVLALAACATRERSGPSTDVPLATTSSPATSARTTSAAPRDGATIPACARSGAGLGAELDDFESGRDDGWFVYTDGTRGGVIERRVDASGDGHALHVTARGFDGWGSGVTRGFGAWTAGQRGCELDASAYGGIRFRARGSGSLRVAVATTPLAPRAEGGECDRGEACFDWPGTDIELTSAWMTFELPFCKLAPSGWGRTGTRVDPHRLYQLHFRFTPNQAHELWLDDVNFLPPSGTSADGCGPVCPLAALPPGAVVDPGRIVPEHEAHGLRVHTFEQPTRSCGTVTRRYLEYLPKRLRSKAPPVVIALHGYGASAEGFRDFQTHGRFEALSEQDGFVVVYANAAPGAATDPRFPNSGAWLSNPEPGSEVDDFDYLARVHDDLAARGEIDDASPTFLVGQSNGGGMVLEAARRNPERYTGFAAFMPFDGQTPVLPAPSDRGRIVRALFVYSAADPGLPSGYDSKLRVLADAWARALGVPAAMVAAPSRKAIPDSIAEGASYAGSAEPALRTRDSRGEELDLASAAERGAPAARYVVFDHAGHFWPNRTPDSAPFVLEKFGFRNQDFDGAEAVWEFFGSALPRTR